MLAGLEIIVLWLMIYETYIHFAKINKMVIYFTLFIWVSFAAVLNGSIWWLNKSSVSFSVQFVLVGRRGKLF
jgi:tryptophan-rich sensory protein